MGSPEPVGHIRVPIHVKERRMQRRLPPSAWDELLRTASAVRATDLASAAPGRNRLRRAIRPLAMTGGLVVACGLAVLHLAGTTGMAIANGGYDSQLFSLTNQDRTSNGVHSLSFSGTLQAIGEGAPYNCRGVQVSGRSVDMIRRNYFAHPILGCGEYVFSMMQAFGIRYRSAGENIGWEAGSSSPASYINSAFMNSSDHRANILASNYTEMGVGSDESAPGVTWTGQGSEQNVWMFSEEFAQVGSSSPPPPRSKPRPTQPGSRNSPAPAAPVAPGASSTPAATPTPLLIPTGSLPQDVPAPPVGGYEGLFPNTIESVLEAFLTF
jgi:uncharacterized protein YkwD